MSDSDNPTVEMNGTELEVVETEDGFEVRELPDEPGPGLYLRAESTGDSGFGFEIPLGGPYAIEDNDFVDRYRAKWDESASVADDLQDDGAPNSIGDADWDGQANVDEVSIVEH